MALGGSAQGGIETGQGREKHVSVSKGCQLVGLQTLLILVNHLNILQPTKALYATDFEVELGDGSSNTPPLQLAGQVLASKPVLFP